MLVRTIGNVGDYQTAQAVFWPSVVADIRSSPSPLNAPGIKPDGTIASAFNAEQEHPLG
jgi:hypothetical protein